MKTYVKPTVEVVELSVKENMAALPSAIKIVDTTTGTYDGVHLTTYNLAAVATSE